MMRGESFKQAAPAGRWTQAPPSYIARTINKKGGSAFIREIRMCLPLFSTHLGLLLSPSLSLHTGKIKPDKAYMRILFTLLSKLLDNYFKRGG